MRLTRIFDKARGFVNGAIGTGCESMRGSTVFTVNLNGTCNQYFRGHVYQQQGT